jgi:hypothetical protein
LAHKLHNKFAAWAIACGHNKHLSKYEGNMGSATPKSRLRSFYDQALLTPELLCLNCSRMAWKGSRRTCSPERKENCLFFVNDMLNWLVAEPGKSAQPPHLPLYD